MPDGNEGEDGKDIHDGFESTREIPLVTFAGGTGAAHGDVDVANDPAVEAAVPTPPEGEGGDIVAHAPDYVFWRVDAVNQRPETEEAPGK